MAALIQLAAACASLAADRAEIAAARATLDAAQAEHDTEATELANARATLNMLRKAAANLPIEAAIERAYRIGKLIRHRDAENPALVLRSPREARLRRIASGPDGLARLQLEIDGLARIVPVGVRVPIGADPNPRELTFATGAPEDQSLDAELAAIAVKTGQSLDDLKATAAQIRARKNTR